MTDQADQPSAITGNTAEAMEFLRNWEPEGPWTLTAIVPDPPREKQRRTFTRTFYPSQAAEAARWIESHQGKNNLYFSVNRPRRDLSDRASKKDIGWVLGLHVDVDPQSGKDIEAERARILSLLRSVEPPPTVIIDSGGGYQAFWKFSQPVALESEDHVD